MEKMQEEKSRFLHIVCPRCRKTAITYGKGSSWVKCSSCNKLLVRPGGGKAKMKAHVRRIM